MKNVLLIALLLYIVISAKVGYDKIQDINNNAEKALQKRQRLQ
jgi:hypothetical protein